MPLLSYEEVLARYRALLSTHPGQALVTSHDTFALFHPDDGHLCWTYRLDGTPCLAFDECFDFDYSAFYEGHWEGDASAEETLTSILYPQFIDLPARHGT